MTFARRRYRSALLALLLAGLPAALHAHGGVVAEDDLCIIRIGYLEAHFKIYVPGISGHTEYCEDIPVRGESVFVMEYLHAGLATAPVAFRIIRNTTGKGVYARPADVSALPDIDAVTVRYEPPAIVPDVYTLLHDFREDGEFIGIVTVGNADRQHTAVFPFAVGNTGIGPWPWIVAALLLLQANFWYWRRRTPKAGTAAVLLLAGLLCAPPSADAQTAQSETGRFIVEYRPSLEPLAINRMHHWDLVVTDGAGRPVADARIDVDGGMPAHDHGLPTAPRAVPAVPAGHYRIDGLRFHMQGEWVLQLTIDDGTQSDRVRIVFRL